MPMLWPFRSGADDAHQHRKDMRGWADRLWESPSPAHVKRAVVCRLGDPDGDWVETGTFMGDTTAALAALGRRVYTIEPEDTLHAKAAARFRCDQRVEVIHGTSEAVLPRLLPRLSGCVNFWLDGHYSGGITFQGSTYCPALQELAAIRAHRDRFTRITVLIDDIRCFDPSDPQLRDYPARDAIVDWCRQMEFRWHIEHDIFCARGGR